MILWGKIKQIILSSIWVAEWPPFGKELHAQSFNRMLNSLCNFSILDISHFGFTGRLLVLTVPVPGH